MDEALHVTLAHWANFYLITGTAAAALTGLQFVVQTLLATDGVRAASRDPEAGVAAFGTPTVVHFALALALSAMLCVPWTSYVALNATLGIVGAAALMYSAIVLRRTLRQRAYTPQLEDWVFHIVLPAAAYGAVLISALLIDRNNDGPLFAIAAATLVLLCVGIHNAWDTVTYLMITALRADTAKSAGIPPSAPSVPQRNNPPRRGRRKR